MSAVGLLAAGFGVLLVSSPRSTSVFADRAGIHIGGVQLREVSSDPTLRVFDGDAAWALYAVGGGELDGGAAAVVNGHASSGRCRLMITNQVTTATCMFRIDGSTLSAVDSFDPQTRQWHRTYSDGRRALFDVPDGGEVVPVVLPLGR